MPAVSPALHHELTLHQALISLKWADCMYATKLQQLPTVLLATSTIPTPTQYLQLGDVVHFVDGRGCGVSVRVGCVQGVNIGQQEQPVCLHQRGHLQGGKGGSSGEAAPQSYVGRFLPVGHAAKSALQYSCGCRECLSQHEKAGFR